MVTDTDRATRRALMAERDRALATRDIPRYQALTIQISELPMDGVKPLTQRDHYRYARGRKRG